MSSLCLVFDQKQGWCAQGERQVVGTVDFAVRQFGRDGQTQTRDQACCQPKNQVGDGARAFRDVRCGWRFDDPDDVTVIHLDQMQGGGRPFPSPNQIQVDFGVALHIAQTPDVFGIMAAGGGDFLLQLVDPEVDS